MATIDIASSTNIGSLTYAAGDVLRLNNAGAVGKVRLTIDGSVSADRTKIEGTLPLGFQVYNNSELYITNSSTTTPLIVQLSSETGDIILNGKLSVFKVRGNWISVGTGTGLIGQTLSTIIAGKTIDWPTFVEVETFAGSGVYVQYININGNRPGSGGVVPTGYRSFADCGTTVQAGAFFEYDEQTKTIYFATASGGHPPPAGANIRIPNIHITSTGLPNYTASTRSQITPAGGVLDFEVCQFSNRWGGVVSFSDNLRFVHTNAPLGFNVQSGVRGNFYLDTCCTTLDVYIAAGGASSSFTTGTIYGSQTYIKDFKFVTQGNSYLIVNFGKDTYADGIYLYQFNRINTTTQNQLFGIAGEPSKKRVYNVYSAGQTLYLNNLRGLYMEGIYLADRTNSTLFTTIQRNGLSIGGSVEDTVLSYIRNFPGAAPCYLQVLDARNAVGRNVAIKNVLFDCQTHSSSGMGLDRTYASRWWLSDINFNNTRAPNSSLVPSNPTGAVLDSVRVLSAGGSSVSSLACTQVMLMRYSSTTAPTINASGGGVKDIDLLHVTKTSTSGVGHLTLFVGTESVQTPSIYQVVSGVEGTDYTFATNGVLFQTTAAEIIWTSKYPAIGVTSMSSAVVPAISGITAEFKIKVNAAGEPWPSSWSTLDTATLRSAFAALTGYNSNDGFHMQVRLRPTTPTSLERVQVSGVSVDEAYAVTDVGYVEVDLVSLTSGSVVGIAKGSPSYKLVGYSTVTGDSHYFEFPHPYEATDVPYIVVSRKPGYSEARYDGDIWITGASVPLVINAQHPTTNAAVAGIDVDGVAKTITVTGTKSFEEVYQHCQYWSCLRTNLLYDIPMSSEDGEVFICPTDWTVDWDIPDGSTLAGARVLLSTAGAYTWNVSGVTIVFDAAGSYDLSEATLIGNIVLENTSGGSVTVAVPAGVSYTNNGPSITVTEPAVYQRLVVSGGVLGSRVQVYDMTNGVELYNGIPSTWPYTYTHPTAYVADIAVRLRVMAPVGTTAYKFVDVLVGTATSTQPTLTYLLLPEVDSVYGSNAIDGTTVTGVTIDDALLRVSVSVPTISWATMYAYETYWLFTEEGIRDEGRIIDAIDQANYEFSGFTIRNDGTGALVITGGYAWDSVAGPSAPQQLFDLTGGSVFPAPPHVVNNVITISGANVITGDIADIPSAVRSELAIELSRIDMNVSDVAQAVVEQSVAGSLPGNSLGSVVKETASRVVASL